MKYESYVKFEQLCKVSRKIVYITSSEFYDMHSWYSPANLSCNDAYDLVSKNDKLFREILNDIEDDFYIHMIVTDALRGICNY